MAYNTYYTKSITTLEGNTLTYELEQDAASTTPATMNLTENSYKLKYFFNDESSTRIGVGYLSQHITLEFMDSDEVDDIRTNPNDWRLTITLDSNVIFVGFPDARSINEFIVPAYSEVYRCTFLNVFARMTNEGGNEIATAATVSSNAAHALNHIPITDLIGEYIVETYTGQSSLVWVSQTWRSQNCISDRIGSGTLRPDPQLRYFSVMIQSDSPYVPGTKVGETLKNIAQAFFLRMGWSHSQGKTIIAQCINGASGTFTGYDCTKVSSGYRTITSSSNISLQALTSSDIIAGGEDVNADNPPFPVRIKSQIESGSEQISVNVNSTYSYLFDQEIDYTNMYWLDDTLSTADPNGISVLGRDIADTVDEDYPIGDVLNVDPSSTGTTYELSEAVNKRLAEDYLFTYGLKGFQTKVNVVLDPMIPISYDSKVWVTPSGTINLFEEITECLLTEIQDNG